MSHRVALINTWRGGAVYNVSHPIYKYLKEHHKDVEYDYITVREIDLDPNFDTSFGDYDLVHFTYFANIRRFLQDIVVPYTCQVHHFGADREEIYCAQLREWAPERIVVPETFVQRQLCQREVPRVVQIPYTFDHSKFTPTPFNEGFSVGFLGCDSQAKKFDVIRKAAKKVGVRVVDFDRNTHNEEEGYHDQEDIKQFYEDISCYVVASWTDGGPLPPQEALLSGRPVIATPVGMLPDLVARGVENITFFDGSITGLVDELKLKKMVFERMMGDVPEIIPALIHDNADRYLPSITEVGKEWMVLFDEVLEELA